MMLRTSGRKLAKEVLRRVGEFAAVHAPSPAAADTEQTLRKQATEHLGAGILDALGERFDELPPFTRVASFAEYQQHCASMQPVYERRAAVEMLIAAGQQPTSYRGYDATMGTPADFGVDFMYGASKTPAGSLVPNYRERLVSSASNLNCRLRATVLAIQHALRGRSSKPAIYATEQLTPFFGFLSSKYPGVVGSEYLGPSHERGVVANGVRHEDVTNLTFPDGTFDVVVSNDVLEHVPDFRAALSEMGRVLRPGGMLVATAPFLTEQHEHLIRARLGKDGKVEHLLEPDYHGDPVNPEGGILCYQYFGWELFDDMRAAGFASASALLTWSYYHGLLGREQMVFFATKAAL